MKRFFLVILIVVSASYCNAQSPIIPLDTYAHQIADGSYVKDLDNELDNFVGTWTFSDGTTSFTIKLQKLEQSFNGDYYEDYLVGEYAYINNGMTIINTIPLLNNTQLNLQRNIGGRYIVTGQDFGCDDCLNDERRIDLYFSDPERKYLSTSLILRYLFNESDPEKITSTIHSRHGTVIPEDGYTSPRVPYGTYLMEKQ